MSDMGDDFREWKQYKIDSKHAASMGVSLSAYRKHMKQLDKEDADERHKKHIERCTIKCECGKWFLDTAAHNCHKKVKGRKGHCVIETKEAIKQEETSWAIY